jgi:tripartite-type tricarboxylate transporter receptor subunit TctC
MTFNTRRQLLIGTAAMLAAGGLSACGQAGEAGAGAEAAYPTRPIILIVPFAPGGASDFIARILQPKLSASLGQQVVVENREGGAGNVAMDYASRRDPDGYSVFIGNVGAIAINPSLFPDLTVKPAEDFIPVSILTEVPSLLIASAKLPATDVRQAVAHAQANPGKVNFASPGAGSLNRLEMEMLKRDAKIDVVHVPYNGSSTPAMMDIMGGHVDMLFLTATTAINQVKDGRVKGIGVTSAERMPLLPDVPTLAEQGYPNIVSSSWQGMFVQKGTPQPIIDKLRAAVNEALKDPEILARIAEGGGRAVGSASEEEARAFIVAETQRWGDLVRSTGAQVN